jgi:predicted dehydrogenase
VSRSGPVGVGVIGAGKISDQYLANMLRFPDLDVRVVADALPETARRQAERFGVAAAATVEEVLARDDVELVVNLTIPAAHAQVAAAALAAGKHVWNEKPIAVDLGSAEALVSDADAAGLRLGVAPDTLLGPGMQTARRLIEAGAIGTPLTAAAVMQYPGPHAWHPNPDFLYQPGGGPLFDMGPYYLGALTEAFGAISRVAARGAGAGPTRTIGQGARAGEEIPVAVPTYAGALYEFEHGAIAQATLSFDSPLKRMGVLEIAGSEATLVAPDPNRFAGEIVLWRNGDERETVPVAGVEGGRGIGAVEMARALRAGEPHRATGRRGLHTLEAMLATAASIESAEFVAVRSRFDPSPALPENWDPTAPTL